MFVEKLEWVLFYLLLLLLPTQLGKHFWPDFSIVSGVRIDYLSPTLYLTDIIIFLLFLIWSLNKRKNSNTEALNSKQSQIINIERSKRFGHWSIHYLNLFKISNLGFWIYLLFFCFLILNVFASNDVWNGLYHLLKFLEFSFIAYYVATTVVRLDQVKKLFMFLGVGLIGQSFLAIVQFLTQGSLGGLFYFFGERTFTAATPGIANASINGELILRSYGTFSHPNVLAGFLLLVMIGLLFFFPKMKGFGRRVSVIALLLGSSALLLTMSRIAVVLWICFLLSIFLFTSLRAVFKQRATILYRVASLFLLAMTIIFVVLTLTQTPFGSRFIQTNLTEEAVVARVDLMAASWQLFSSQPIIGVGFGNFLPQLATVASPLPLNIYLQPVHNIFILVLAETGIIGLGIFIWFLVKTYQRLIVLIKKGAALPYRLFVVLLSLILVIGSFDHYFLTLQQGQLLLSFILGLSWTRLRG